MRRADLPALVLVIATLLEAPAAQSIAVLSDDFEEPNLTGPATTQALSAGDKLITSSSTWDVVVDDIDLVRSDHPSVDAHDGDQSVDLTGVEAGVMETAFSTQPGQTYELSFFYSRNVGSESEPQNQASARVSVIGNTLRFEMDFSHSTADGSQSSFLPFSGSFVADSSTTKLRFTSLTGTARAGIVIDSVLVSDQQPGCVFVTGHDPIWHSDNGSNFTGGRNLALAGIGFARNGSTLPFLFVESVNVPVPSGNAKEAPALINGPGPGSGLGFSSADFVVADVNVLNSFPNFRAALNSFSAIVVASDHGGMLSASELQFLNAHADDIIDYVNGGGGIFAGAESDAKGLIGSTPRYGFLPFLVSSTDFTEPETANTVTPLGQSLGLMNSDVNGNFSHSFFTDTGGVEPVDLRNGDESQPLSLAFCGTICPSGILTVALTPETDLNELGQDHQVTAVVGCGDEPKPGVTVTFTVESGPNAGSTGTCLPNPDCTTDAGGAVSFTYAGDGGSGADRITASFVLDGDGETITSDPAFKFWDEDCNQNQVADTCDLSCGAFDGNCAAYSGCDGSDDSNQNGVPDECNTDPVCRNAFADPGSLWPPNHVLAPIGISGVTDAENDPLTITATSVAQDEAVARKGIGSGHTSPDAALSPLAVRAERNGNPKTPGNGRMYHISFTADDGEGGSCNGTVNVCVPHDRRSGSTCVDDGPLYDSIP